MKDLDRVPGIDLTTEWNHSDDELAFLSYWNLYRYAFTPELREQYRQAIRDHWEVERPEKNPLWNFLYAATGAERIRPGGVDLESQGVPARHHQLDRPQQPPQGFGVSSRPISAIRARRPCCRPMSGR